MTLALVLSITTALASAVGAEKKAPPPPAKAVANEPAKKSAPPAKSPTESLPAAFGPRFGSVVVMPLSSLGSTDEVVLAIERVLQSELKKLVGAKLADTTLMTLEQVTKRKKGSTDQVARCSGAVECLAPVMSSLGVDAFVVGNIAGLGDDRVINIKLFEARTGALVNHASEPASGDEKVLIANMRKAAVTLLAPELLVGTVELACSQTGVEVVVDGVSLGKTPLAATRRELPVGRHAIEANAPGLVPFSTLVDVAYGETKKVAIALPVNTVFVGGDTPFRARWWTWSIAGSGALAVGMGVFFNCLQADTVAKINQRAAAGTLTIDHAYLYRQEEEQWITAVVFYAVGALLMTGVGALLGVDFVLL
jgi:hypothetical protein